MPRGSRASPEHRLRMTIRMVVVAERVCCFIGTRFSNLYTAVDTPAEAA